MKESISITAIFQIVVLFVLLFTAIMCLTINNANAFGVKDELINIIELSKGDFLSDEGGLNEEVVNLINETSYRTTGNCNKVGDDFVGYSRTGDKIDSGENAAICIKEVNVTDGIDKYLEDQLGADSFISDDFLKGVYYQIVVFYQLDVPIVNQAYNLSTKGETKVLYSR